MTNQENFLKNLEEDIRKNIKINEEMKKYTSFKIGGPADMIYIAKDKLELKKVLKAAKEYMVPVNIIGNGTNILVKDKGIEGLTIKIQNDDIKIDKEDCKIEVGAGSSIIAVSKKAKDMGLSGLEFASGIPGSIGGAIYMNAGAYGSEIKDITVLVQTIDIKTLEEKEYLAKDLEFSYRDSIFSKKNEIIWKVILKLENRDIKEIEKKMEEYKQKRMSSQPYDMPSAGSTFKRGDGFITAQLIDQAGLKGLKIGGAQVSTKHAGFIVNAEGATCKDVLDLIEQIETKVKEKFGKTIQKEIKVIGK